MHCTPDSFQLCAPTEATWTIESLESLEPRARLADSSRNARLACSPRNAGTGQEDPWMDPMWQSRPLNTSFFQVDLPRTDGIFHNQASFSAQPHPQVNPTPVTPVREQAGVVQAELAGPVQVEAPPISGTKEDGWDRIADAIGTPALNPLRAELTRGAALGLEQSSA
eukprot:s1436_g3.t1